jgi:hypothetical protein
MTTQDVAAVPATFADVNAAAAAAAAEDASKEDAKILARVYFRLIDSVKAVKAAERDIRGAWIGQADLIEVRAARFSALEKHDRIMDESWTALNDLPKGTVAPGGATPQTVGLQFFNANLNRTLGKRLTTTDARAMNRRSFG